MSLEEVIAESPCVRLPETFWMFKASALSAERRGTWSQTDDATEITIISAQSERPSEPSYGPLRGFQLRVSKPFDAPGFLAAACTAIASAGVAILVQSTYSYDYIFVASENFELAEQGLVSRGFSVTTN